MRLAVLAVWFAAASLGAQAQPSAVTRAVEIEQAGRWRDAIVAWRSVIDALDEQRRHQQAHERDDGYREAKPRAAGQIARPRRLTGNRCVSSVCHPEPSGFALSHCRSPHVTRIPDPDALRLRPRCGQTRETPLGGPGIGRRGGLPHPSHRVRLQAPVDGVALKRCESCSLEGNAIFPSVALGGRASAPLIMGVSAIGRLYWDRCRPTADPSRRRMKRVEPPSGSFQPQQRTEHWRRRQGWRQYRSVAVMRMGRFQ